jgi:general secretion pathway protein M
LAIHLTRRDQYALYLGAGLLAIWLIFQLVVSPLFNHLSLMKRQIAAKEKILAEMMQLRSEHITIRGKSEEVQRRLNQRKPSFTLFLFMDQLAGEVGVKENISYMKPSTRSHQNEAYRSAMVEMKLTSVTMKAVMAYLYHIETSGNLVMIRRLSITRPDRDAQHVDVVLQAETMES